MLKPAAMRVGGIMVAICLGLLQPAGAATVCALRTAHTPGRLPAVVQELADLNQAIERGQWTIEKMVSAGLIVLSEDPVMGVMNGSPEALPLRKVLLPVAKTGFYLPSDVKFRSNQTFEPYQGIFLMMPGIGTNVSNATTLHNLGLTLMSGKNPALATGDGNPKMRLLPVMLDATMGGLGENAPDVFGQPEAAVQVARHARLIMKLLFSSAPFILAGRSQGGLIAMEYSLRYQDIDALVAVNPSPSEFELHRLSIRTSEAAIAGGNVADVQLVLNRTWKVYDAVAPLFQSFRRNKVSRDQVPSLLLIANNDPAYGGKPYLDHVAAYVAEDPSREVEYFDVRVDLSHDLWSRRDRRLFASVVKRMTAFIYPKLRP